MNQYNELPKSYEPQSVEPKWYQFWLDKGYFHAEEDSSKEPYSITIPPPNITGSLHIGHALCYTIQDVLGRWKRMQGYNTVIIPGTDHAGIATQNKVEQEIAKNGLTRHDLGREEFVKRVWEWKEKYGSTIINQFKRMGYSFDWDRLRFTLDSDYSDAVLEEFVRWFNEGYIYRGVRVINWCPRCRTAISDIEVEYKDMPGNLWDIDYPLEDGSGYITVATTRPETMLGDTAIAVSPDDDRYKDLVGKNAILPIMNRPIPIVADAHVDKDFGTGAVKVTPAHDPNDFEIGQRHNLPSVIVIGQDGCMTEEAGSYAGMDRDDARKLVVEELKKQNLLNKEEEYSHSVGTCARCSSVIEPLLSEQWFAKMQAIAQPAIDAVKDGRIKFVPERYVDSYLDWMENIRDWCISRQLWWGHRIPVWKCDDCGEYIAAKSAPAKCSKCNSVSLTQDEDVLDTWFSSALWPFAVMGWPNQDPSKSQFYPTSVLTTARDIIYLWVARMIMTSLYFIDDIPFKDVYIYATVLNEEGRRMSKSLGTGVDPLEVIDSYGADALRFALLQQAGKGQDIRFSTARVEAIRLFCNKLWNISRFVILNLDDSDIPSLPDGIALKTEDEWILSRLEKTIETINNGLGNYDMDDAARALYEFLWNEFADWYIEISKPRLRTDDKQAVQYILWHVLETSLRLMHPFMPFITEQIWQSIPHAGESIMIADYPSFSPERINEAAENSMGIVMDVIRAIRNLRAEIGVAPGKTVECVVLPASKECRECINAGSEAIKSLSKLKNLTVTDTQITGETKYLSAHIGSADIYVMLSGAIDIEHEISRLQAELEGVDKELSRSMSKLENEKFILRAPANIIEKERRIVQELTDKKMKLQERMDKLSD